MNANESLQQPHLAVGDAAPERRVGPINRTDIVRYAGAGGDFNPIHHDETFAQRAGYRSVFGHGLLTAGMLSAYAASWLGLAALRKYSVRYVSQVWPGDTLILNGRVAEVDTATNGAIEVRCDLSVQREAANGERQEVLTARAVAAYRPERRTEHA